MSDEAHDEVQERAKEHVMTVLQANDRAFYDSMVTLIRDHDDRGTIEAMRREIRAVHDCGDYDDPLSMRVREQQLRIIDQALDDTS